MDWDVVGAISEIVGAIAVIVSIVYLATHILSNSAIARAESQRELLDISTWFAGTATDAELRRAVRAGFNEFAALSKDEQLQFHSWMHPIAAQIEAA